MEELAAHAGEMDLLNVQVVVVSFCQDVQRPGKKLRGVSIGCDLLV